jgi:hypothetical protein
VLVSEGRKLRVLPPVAGERVRVKEIKLDTLTSFLSPVEGEEVKRRRALLRQR